MSSSPLVGMMHRAERKYQVGKVADEEEAKQRQLRAILNKLTPQNFEKLFEQVKQVNIDNLITLTGLVQQILDRALMEPIFCQIYARLCYHLAVDLPDFSLDNEKISFKRLLLNQCQKEFERQEVEQWKEEPDEGKRDRARRRTVGNVILIGELYKERMLTERIIHECVKKLLGGPGEVPDEEDVEALCKLMTTVGETIDHPRAKEHMDAYFDMMAKLSTCVKLPSRVRFMLLDAIDLRKNKWQQSSWKAEGPRKIEQLHRDARSTGKKMSTLSNRRSTNDYPIELRYLPMRCGICMRYLNIRIVSTNMPTKGMLFHKCDDCNWFRWCNPHSAIWADSGIPVVPTRSYTIYGGTMEGGIECEEITSHANNHGINNMQDMRFMKMAVLVSVVCCIIAVLLFIVTLLK